MTKGDGLQRQDIKPFSCLDKATLTASTMKIAIPQNPCQTLHNYYYCSYYYYYYYYYYYLLLLLHFY